MTNESASPPGPAADLLRRVDEVRSDARALGEGLSPAQLAWRPADGGWSVGEVFEHLVTSDALYHDRVRDALAKAEARGGPRDAGAPWKPSLLGGFLARSLEAPRKLPSPKVFRPAETPRPGVVREYVGMLDALEALIRRAEGLDWRRIRTASPVSRLIRLNLGDCFAVLAVHGRRHMGQVRRVRESAGFPAS